MDSPHSAASVFGEKKVVESEDERKDERKEA
jgi:hypothetical protein